MTKVLLSFALLVTTGHEPRQAKESPTLSCNATQHQTTNVPVPSNTSQLQPCQTATNDRLPPWWFKPEWYLVILGFPTLGVVVWQAAKTHQAAEAGKTAALAGLRQIEHATAIERPFVMIEARGDDHVHFWAVNHGRSPAQIIFMNPVPFVITPLSAELPEKLNYGLGYDNPDAEQINVQWIPAKGEQSLGDLDPVQIGLFSDELRAELRSFHRVLLVYSGLKYKGIAGDEVYTSTYCYRRAAGATIMWGGDGWNRYT